MITSITVFTLLFFNIAFFVLGRAGTNSAAIWIAYAFIHLAGICQMATPLLFSEKEATTASIGMSLRVISLVHFLSTVAVGVIIILVIPDGWKASFLVLLFITLVYISLFVAMLFSYRKILRP